MEPKKELVTYAIRHIESGMWLRQTTPYSVWDSEVARFFNSAAAARRASISKSMKQECEIVELVAIINTRLEF